MTGRCTRWQRWLPGSGGGLKVLNWNLHSFQLLEIIQVLDSISWVRCASGNVFLKQRFCIKINFYDNSHALHFFYESHRIILKNPFLFFEILEHSYWE